jgi:transcriptional regulator with GAF, ATPase, and Fis domain
MRASERLLIGGSHALRRVRDLIRTVAPTRLPVLIHGETGTGKELVACSLHEESGRRGPLVSFNVCAIAETMFEDSLFGHVRGAFTGAASDSIGLLREADGGSAFFDEVSGLPASLQPKLLRVIETGVLRPVGGSRDVHSDFRVVTATNDHLSKLVTAGRFRADLAHRLSGVVIHVPPLRERAEDIPMLAKHFLGSFCEESPAVLRPEVMSLMMEREWTGNVREFRQVIEAAAVLGGNVVDAESYSLALSSRSSDAIQARPSMSPRGRLLAELERSEWDTRIAAERLGIHRATVYRWMRRYNLAPPASAIGRIATC